MGETLRVREIRATLQREGYRSVHLRLWPVSWMSPRTRAGVSPLVQLYATRWQQELYFRELKRESQAQQCALQSNARDRRPRSGVDDDW
jgi:hypothetical protein